MGRPKKVTEEKTEEKTINLENTEIQKLEEEKSTNLNYTGFNMDEQQPNPNGKVWTKDELLEYHNKVITDSNKITLEDETTACFTYCINTSGGYLMLDDIEAKLQNPQSELMITIEPGERFNLQSFFTKRAINRNRRHLIGAMKMKSQLYGLPALLNVESLDVNLPFPVVVKSTMEKMKSKGLKIVEMPANEYDEKLKAEIKKEKDYNDRLVRRPGEGEQQLSQEEFEKQFQ